MSNHQKRLSAPDSWPVERKSEKFTVKADAGPHGEAGVPLLIILRDVLGYADSRKEARYALDQDSVLINGKAVSDEERPVGMFDILAFAEREEYYRVFPGEGGRLSLTPIDEEAAGSKLGKIVGKRHVPGGDVQLTLHDGQTLVVEENAPYEGGDSLVVSNDDGDVVAHFEYEAGALVTAVDGAHSGEVGTVEEIQVTPGSSENIVRISQDTTDGGFETTENYVVVIDENFTEDESEETAAVDEEADADTDEGADLEEEPGEDEEDVDAEPDENEEAADVAEADEEDVDAEADDDEEADADADDEEADADEEDADAEADEDEEAGADADDEEAEEDDDEADVADGGDDQ